MHVCTYERVIYYSCSPYVRITYVQVTEYVEELYFMLILLDTIRKDCLYTYVKRTLHFNPS